VSRCGTVKAGSSRHRANANLRPSWSPCVRAGNVMGALLPAAPAPASPNRVALSSAPRTGDERARPKLRPALHRPRACRPELRPRAPSLSSAAELRRRASFALWRRLPTPPPPPSLCAHMSRQDLSKWDGGECFLSLGEPERESPDDGLENLLER
jgi:hypothetical protein